MAAIKIILSRWNFARKTALSSSADLFLTPGPRVNHVSLMWEDHRPAPQPPPKKKVKRKTVLSLLIASVYVLSHTFKKVLPKSYAKYS